MHFDEAEVENDLLAFCLGFLWLCSGYRLWFIFSRKDGLKTTYDLVAMFMIGFGDMNETRKVKIGIQQLSRRLGQS